MYFRKVRIAQGANSVTADQGQATREALSDKGFDNSLWVFRGNVKITMEGGLLSADEAQINFAKKLLSKAVAHGKPAEFEQRLEKTGKVARGHADDIDYDAANGVVRLTKNAWLSDGDKEVHARVAQVQRARAKHHRRRRRPELPASTHHHHADDRPHQTMSVLRALNLAKSYKSRTILKDISLEVESGEVVGLLGPNGAGKTTAFYMIVGLTRCEHGEIFLDNKDIGRLPMHRRAQLGLGYLPQEPSVFRRMSVSSNIMAILETRPGLDEAKRRARLDGAHGRAAYRPRTRKSGHEPYRAESGAAWRSRAPSPPTPASSYWMSPLRVSTRCPCRISRE